MVAIESSASPNDPQPIAARDALFTALRNACYLPDEATALVENFRAEVLREAGSSLRDLGFPDAGELLSDTADTVAPSPAPAEADGPLCTCGHGQNRHYTDNSYGAPGPIYGCYDCPTSTHLHQFTPAGGAR